MPTIITWNMQGANDEKWVGMVKSMLPRGGPDAVCLQECGAPPSSATRLPPVAAITNDPAGQQAHTARWKVGTGDQNRYILWHNFGTTPGSRCNLAIVCREAPTAWWIIAAAFGNEWRPAIGATLQNGAVVFSVHAISPGGPDALALIAAIASTVQGNTPQGAQARWYVGGDFNREPASWNNQALISAPDKPTHPTRQPGRSYDYLVSSVPANAGVVGERLDDTAPWSDHFAVVFRGLG